MSAPAYSGSLSGRLCCCTVCGHTFGGERGFGLHRGGEYAKPGQWQGARRCLTPAEIRAGRLAQDERGDMAASETGAAANAELGPSAQGVGR